MKINLLKKLVLTLLLTGFLTGAYAQDSGIGLGLYLGEPTGIGWKAWVADNGAFAGAVAWSIAGERLHLHADYHRHSFELIDVSQGQLPVYYGLGAKIVFADDPVIGARIPLGINYIFADAPLDIFAEVVPGLDFVPSTDFDLAGGIGIRFYFNQ